MAKFAKNTPWKNSFHTVKRGWTSSNHFISPGNLRITSYPLGKNEKIPPGKVFDLLLGKVCPPLYGYKMKWPISYDENTAIVKKTVSR